MSSPHANVRAIVRRVFKDIEQRRAQQREPLPWWKQTPLGWLGLEVRDE